MCLNCLFAQSYNVIIYEKDSLDRTLIWVLFFFSLCLHSVRNRFASISALEMSFLIYNWEDVFLSPTVFLLFQIEFMALNFFGMNFSNLLCVRNYC